jgi:hypothetical protein
MASDVRGGAKLNLERHLFASIVVQIEPKGVEGILSKSIER